MGFKLLDRVQETSTTTGTGAFTLAGAYTTGYRTFASVLSTSDTTRYCIEALDSNGNPTGDWEVGLGTYSGASTLTRTTVVASSNSNAAVSFATGTKRVMMDADAAYLASLTGTTGLLPANNLSDVASAATSRTNLGLAIGTNVQAYNLKLATIAANTVSSQTGTAYTAVLADADTYIQFSNASAISFTIPQNSSVAFPIGTVIEVEQAGAGALTIVAGTGTTLNSRAADLTLAGQYSVAFVKKVATNTWTVNGDL